MSYDVYMVVDTGGTEPAYVTESRNYTYNVSPMFRAALGGKGLNDLQGLSGAEAAVKLTSALAFMVGHRDEMVALNPENGWGDYNGALRFLEGILEDCLKHPKAQVRIS